MKMAILAAGLGTRMRAVSNGRSKVFLEVGGRSLLDRLLDIAALLGAEPLVVTRPELADEFLPLGLEVLVEESPEEMLGTLYHVRSALQETFCWVAGDMLFSDPAPLSELVAAHREQGVVTSFFYSRTSRFKAKLRL